MASEATCLAGYRGRETMQNTARQRDARERRLFRRLEAATDENVKLRRERDDAVERLKQATPPPTCVCGEPLAKGRRYCRAHEDLE